MWICHCNPFDDKAVKSCLDAKKGETTQVSHVYKSCSGGNSPNCGRCINTLREIVQDHNRVATVEQLRQATVHTDKNAPAYACASHAAECALQTAPAAATEDAASAKKSLEKKALAAPV